MIPCVEQHGAWIVDCLEHMRAHGLTTMEASGDAQNRWVEHVASLVDGTMRVHESCTSWYVGANIPGKTRAYLPYAGGFNVYSELCRKVAEAGYEGFALA